MRVRFTRTAIAGSLWLASCNSVDRTTVLTDGDEGANGTPPPSGLNDPLATIAADTVVSGFKHGRLRKELEVAGFSISKHPITVGQYRACVDANVCTSPAHDCANFSGTNPDGAARDAALCVGEDNARAYCAWSGGRLPKLSEWLLAARGRSPRRFSWGDGSATCDQHGVAHAWLQQLQRSDIDTMRAADDVPAETDCATPSTRPFEVAKHAAGASPFGIEDVLIAKAELLGGYPENHFAVCEGSEHGCIVYGLIPGAIDAVRATDEARESAITHPYTFRCAWSKEGS